MEPAESDKLKGALRNDLRRFVERHADLSDVYALAVAFDPDQGSMIFAIADEPGMGRVLEERYPDVIPSWEEGLWGVRWNPSDFPHVGEPEASADLLAMNRESFISAVFEALSDFGDALDDLDTTDDFVFFASAFDQSEAERKEWMRRTVDEELFARLFPGIVAFEEFVSKQSEAAPAEQARFWADAMENLAQQTPTPETRALMKMGRTSYDAEDALIALGPIARPHLLEIVERHALRPQLTEPGSEARARFGTSAPSSNLTTSAAFALSEIGGLSDSEIERLQAVLASLVADYPDDGTVGINAAVIARVLHQLDPERFPEPEIGAEDNRLRNSDAF